MAPVGRRRIALERALECGSRLVNASQPREQLGSAGVPEMEPIETGQLIESVETGQRTVSFTDGNSPVESYDLGRLSQEERVIQRHDVGPVGVCVRCGARVTSCDRGLQLEPPDALP